MRSFCLSSSLTIGHRLAVASTEVLLGEMPDVILRALLSQERLVGVITIVLATVITVKK